MIPWSKFIHLLLLMFMASFSDSFLYPLLLPQSIWWSLVSACTANELFIVSSPYCSLVFFHSVLYCLGYLTEVHFTKEDQRSRCMNLDQGITLDPIWDDLLSIRKKLCLNSFHNHKKKQITNCHTSQIRIFHQ